SSTTRRSSPPPRSAETRRRRTPPLPADQNPPPPADRDPPSPADRSMPLPADQSPSLAGMAPSASSVGPMEPAVQTAPAQPGRAPLVFAHRGASAELPEHTIDAYLRALADGADGVEADVRLTRDGHLRSEERRAGAVLGCVSV